MGGFTLNGPNNIIQYVYTSDIRCKCMGLCVDITDSEEKKFIGKHSMTLDEFHRIFDNKYLSEYIHIYVPDRQEPGMQGDKNKIKILNYTIKHKM